MKKILMYVIIFAFCVAICEQRIDYTSGNATTIGSPITLSFTSIGAISFASRLDSWAKIDSAASPQELEQITKTILNNLDLKTDRVKSEDSAQISRREYQLDHQDSSLELTVEADYQKDETSIIFAYTSNGREADPGQWVPKLEALPGWDWHHYYLYSGYLPEAADSEKRQQLLQEIMNKLQARTKEAFADDRAASLSGYSQALGDVVSPVWVGNHQINVQTAVRSQSDGKTVVLIGSPLILADY